MAMAVEPRSERCHSGFRAIPEVLAVHFEEFAALWAIRREHVPGPDWTLRDLAAWDARLAAHLGGLVAAGDAAIVVLEEALASDDPAKVFAAALVLLRINRLSAVECLLGAAREAHGPRLVALAEALSASSIEGITPRLREVALAGSPPQSLVAGLALAAHGQVDSKFVPRDDAFGSEDPHVRDLAWRCVAHLPAPT